MMAMLMTLWCPTCPLGQFAEQSLISGGYTVHFFAGGTFFLAAGLFLLWAWKSGQFKNAEHVSRQMFERELRAEFPVRDTAEAEEDD